MITEIIYYLTIRPLEILFETIFFISYRFIGKPFATIIALSIFVNILVLPLYKRADKLQAEQREREKAMESRLSHIKKTFKGDEKVMMTQAYYRICDYKPVYALRGASSLLLQIPFFIAAFRFLSGLEMIKGMPSILLPLSLTGGVPTYLIKDLGAPDAMFTVHGMAVNVLPILMTLINIVSGTIYSKGHLRKEKVQLYVTALVFLLLLYNSPAGLVLYWTFNNFFSLCKNSVQKLFESRKKASAAVKASDTDKVETATDKPLGKVYDSLFCSCALLMALITGLFIPSNVLDSSATEFINPLDVFNPTKYIAYSLSLSIGFFVIWIGIYYLFSSHKVRKYFSLVFSAFTASAVINYLMSGGGLGTISADLIYDHTPVFSAGKVILNIALIALAAVLISFLFVKKSAVITSLALAGSAALVCVSAMNINHISAEYRNYEDMHSGSDAYQAMPEIKLSRTGKNVLVIMLDRAIGPLVPYILNERPDLMTTYDGFTYYHDTVSHGRCTNIGMPSVFGGYEYTPYAMNKRDTELLEDKTNEALKVLPVLFGNNGYEVTVMDPPLAGYEWTPDLSIYDDYPDFNLSISEFKLYDQSEELWDLTFLKRKRNLFYFSFMKSLPLFVQGTLYDDGDYNFKNVELQSEDIMNELSDMDIKSTETWQHNVKLLTSDGINSDFMSWYAVLNNLKSITTINDNDNGEFLMMYNCTTHEETILQLPDYKPALHVDNTAFDVEKYYTINGVTMHMDTPFRVSHYHVNMAALLRIGEWLDYLKEEGVYDNTRIILVADHGHGVGWFYGFTYGKKGESCDWYTPLLMMKDFNAHGFTTNTDLMTNADACVLAVSGDVVEEAVNPFTGNPLDGHEKYEDLIRINTCEEWDIKINNGTKIMPSDWYAITGSPYDTNNWEYLYYE